MAIDTGTAALLRAVEYLRSRRDLVRWCPTDKARRRAVLDFLGLTGHARTAVEVFLRPGSLTLTASFWL